MQDEAAVPGSAPSPGGIGKGGQVAIEVTAGIAEPGASEARATVVFEGAEVSGLDAAFARRAGFEAKVGETLVLQGSGGRLEIVVGAGPVAGADNEALRRAAAAAVRAAWRCESLSLDLGSVPWGSGAEAAAAAAVEGALLAAYSYDRHRSNPKPCRLGALAIAVGQACPLSQEALAAAVGRAARIAAGVNLTRDLVNEPAGELFPERVAERAAEIARACGLGIEIWDESRIAAEGLGGLAGVGSGSARPPRLVKLTYSPPDAPGAPLLAFVGKGITFDSGGLSLKPAGGMETMKTDMAGAAAVLGAMSVLADLGAKTRVVGFLALAENMPGGSAIKPGDVLKARNGKTIEVLNTDAEGRLVLADALSLAAEEGPDGIVDLATLTGACVMALGREIAGLISNGEAIADRVSQAAGRAGEKLWPLPLAKEYRSHIDSEVADMKNIGAAGQAGASAAALLLAEFVGERPWAHLDIAGPARNHEDRGYQRKGGSGFGVRTLVELACSWQPVSS